MKKPLTFLLPLLASLFGCSLAPDYIRPASPIPEELPISTSSLDESTQLTLEKPTAVEISPQEFFGDPQLLRVIEIALSNNSDLRLAAHNVERASALYGVQRAQLFPTLNAEGRGDRHQTSGEFVNNGESRDQEQYSVNLGIASWEIDFFGRMRSLEDQAMEEFLATDEARRATHVALVSEVATGFFTLAAYKENLKLAQSTLENQQSAYLLVKQRYDLGVATELDLKRAQAPVDIAIGDIARYTQIIAQSQNALSLLTGYRLSEEFLPTDLSSVTPPKGISTGISSEVLLCRPDIIAAEHRLKGAYALIGAARAAFFPRISLTTTVGTASDELSGLFKSGADTWSFTPQIVMPIFDARVWAAARVSEAERNIAQTQYEKTIQSAFRDIADALAVQSSIDQQLAAKQSLVAVYTDTYRIANERYTEGLDSFLSVLDAQRSLYAAHQELVSIQLLKLANQVRLYAALGGGDNEGLPQECRAL